MVTPAQVQHLLDGYVTEDVVDVEADTMGVSNETLFVSCASGRRYVIRLIALQTRESVRAEVLIQRRLLDAGIGTPRYLARRDGAVVGSIEGRDCTVALQVAGEHPADTSPVLVADIGRTLARMHDALPQAEIGVEPNSGQWLDPHNANGDAEQAPDAVRAALQESLAAASDVMGRDLPMAVIHGEFGSNNFFAADERVTVVFDWETVQHAPRVLDVAFGWVSVVYDDELAPEAVRDALLAGYDEVSGMPLSDEERAVLPRAVTFVSGAAAAWCYRRGYDSYGSHFLTSGARYA